jgi:hypothetical protein
MKISFIHVYQDKKHISSQNKKCQNDDVDTFSQQTEIGGGCSIEIL